MLFWLSQILGTPKVGVRPEKFNIGNVAQNFFGGFYICWDYAISFSQHFPMKNFSPSPPTSPSPLSHWNSEYWLKLGKIFFLNFFKFFFFFFQNIHQSIYTMGNIYDFLNIFFYFFPFFTDFWKKISDFLKKYDQNSTASTAKFCNMTSIFDNFPGRLTTWVILENCKKCYFLLQLACGSGAI